MSTISSSTMYDTINYDYENNVSHYESESDYESDYESFNDYYEPEPYEIPVIEHHPRTVRAPKPINTMSLLSQKNNEQEKIALENLESEKAMFQGYVSSLGNRQIQEDAIMPWGERLSTRLVSYLKVNSSLIVSPATRVVEKEEIKEEKDLSKTSLCKSVIVNGALKPSCGVCKFYGDTCRFAHNLEQISFRPCGFGSRCNCVNRQDDTKYSNRGKRICRFIHPLESVAHYFCRIGINVVVPDDYKPVIAEKTIQAVNKKYTTVTMSDFCSLIKTDSDKEPKKNSKSVKVVVKVVAPTKTKTPTPIPTPPTEHVKPVASTQVPVKAPAHASNKWTTIKKTKTKRNKKDKITEKETKHALCKHFQNCRYGTKCGWAHSLDELKPCRFGNECRSIEKRSGSFVNKKNCRTCKFKHPGETLKNICKRMK